MLLGARQFFEKRGAPTPPLPYDAEVEYIDSVVPAYIDTGVPISRDVFAVICDAAFLSDASIYSTMIGTEGDYYCLIRIWEGFGRLEMWWRGWNIYAPSDTSNLFSRHTFMFSSSGAFVDGVRYGGLSGAFSGSTNPTIKVAGYNTGNTQRQGRCRYWGVKILGSDERPIRDMFPVSFTNEQGVSEGAMYDRVSGTLFRNAGTGAFTIGPNK